MATQQPTVYEINTAVFLHELGEGITLANVPDIEWDKIAALPIDMVWFMGVWQRSPRSRDLNEHAEWLREYLPDVTPDDVLGSAYSIRNYVVDEHFGGDEALAVARQKLDERGIRLMLDFVPNHIAIDHPWVSEHPEYLISGTAHEQERNPDAFVNTKAGVFANGKDPHFPPWSDVLQLNAFSPSLRSAAIATLRRIATMCDAVRCDMAMLMLTDIFHKVWGTRAGEKPKVEYWQEVIPTVKSDYPEFIFVAEAYWQKERILIEQGFDFVYDKDTYDALVGVAVHKLQHHLREVDSFQSHLLRFIENHDEPRAVREFSFARHRAAAVLALTLPGMRLIHEGQRDGRKVRVPVQLRRRQDEPIDEPIAAFYDELFGQLRAAHIGQGSWRREPQNVHLFHQPSPHVFAWSWQNEVGKTTILVNYGAKPCKLQLRSGEKYRLDGWEYRFVTNQSTSSS